MKNPLKPITAGLLAVVAFAVTSPAALVLNETFTYADGPLTQVSSGVWSNHSGTLMQVDVSANKVNLSQAESEDVNALLTGRPYTSGNLYASFVVNFSALPTSGAGTYFAHFKDDGVVNLRARVFATAAGAAAGTFRVGVANGGGAAVIIARDLPLGTDLLLVLRYDAATGVSTLWINPGSEGATADRADGTDSATAPGITTFALRQSNATGGMGVLTLDDLKVGTAFSDVVAGGDPTLNPPSLSSISDQSIPANSVTPAVPFVVSDGETPAAGLALSGNSSNPALVPDVNIVFAGGDSNRTVTVTPLAGQQGSAIVTVTVTDIDNNSASRLFLVAVGAPTLSAIPSQTTPKDTATPAITFTVSDSESDPLTVSAASTNEALVPVGNIAFDGTGANRTVTVTPAAGVSGVTRITVFVTDGFNTASNSFVLTVFPSRGVDLGDTFTYDDGSVVTNSFFTWNTHSAGTGQTGQTQVVQGKLFLSGSQSEDIHAFLTNAPYLPAEGWILYARFTVNFTARPTSGAGDYFAHFRNAGNSFGARVFATTSGAGSDKLRLGIANNAGSPSATLPVDLDTNVTHVVITRLNVATGQSKLWVNAASENDAGATATDNAFPFDVFTYAFRQSGGIGAMAIDDVKIGTSFADVASGIPPRLAIAQIGSMVEVSWTTNSVDFVLQTSTDATSPGLWQNVALPPIAGERYLLSIPNPTGNLFYRLRKP